MTAPAGIRVAEETRAKRRAPGRRIDYWRPEDERFWARTGERVARRNLVFSVFSEHIAFSVWSLWSVFVLFMGPKYGFDAGQKFLLITVPTAVGALLRLPYTLAVARFGGRNWTVASTALLLVPTLAAAAWLHPGVSFGAVLILAAVAGVGGANFASSMANIEAFFPQRRKGWALGINAGGGNVGVAAVQLVGLFVLVVAGSGHPRLILAIYLPLIVLAALGASWGMDNLTHLTNDPGVLRAAWRDGHTWLVSLLYVGTFGSFIGFSFAFGQVLQIQFKAQFDTPIKAAYLTFLGPLLGSLARPLGGRLADRFGGPTVTATVFVAMSAATGVVLAASAAASLGLFIAGFVALFILSGAGNGSTYKMIPAIFDARARRQEAAGEDPAEASRQARCSSRALIGVAGAVGAAGGVGVNLAFRQSFLSTHSGDAAYLAFLSFYLVCLAVTLGVYSRDRRSLSRV